MTTLRREAIGRSENMRRIRSKNTKPELSLRRALFAKGLRYRIHAKNLPGKPDVVFRKQKIAILVHGCFWHQHPGCREASRPRSNTTYWATKLQRNVERDQQHEVELTRLGFRVLTFWECDIEHDVAKIANEIARSVRRLPVERLTN